MKDVSRNEFLFGVETMHGFDRAIAELASTGLNILYAPLPALIDVCRDHRNVLGIVKGPRTQLHGQELDLLARRQPELVISYIGRHPSTALAPDVSYARSKGRQAVLEAQTASGEVPILSLAQSPLSSAVCAYVVTLSLELLQNHDEHIQQLSIQAGNTFSIRRGHGLTEYSLQGQAASAHTNVAIIGAG